MTDDEKQAILDSDLPEIFKAVLIHAEYIAEETLATEIYIQDDEHCALIYRK